MIESLALARRPRISKGRYAEKVTVLRRKRLLECSKNIKVDEEEFEVRELLFAYFWYYSSL
jgi:hypothetical protein